MGKEENNNNNSTNPFNRAARGLGWLLSAYVCPTSLQKAAVALLLSSCIMMPTAKLFPSAEDILKKEGVDPAILTTLTDSDVYIGSQDQMERLYFILRAPHILAHLGMAYYYDYIKSSPGNAYLDKASLFDIRSWLGGEDYSLLLLVEKENLSAEQLTSNITTIPRAYIEYTGVSARDIFLHMLLHEIRHSATANKKLPRHLKEADADYHASIASVDGLSGNPEIKKVAVNNYILIQFLRIADPAQESPHNIALYLDARFRELEPPDKDDVTAATREAYEKMRPYLRADDKRDRFIRYTEAFRQLLTDDKTLPPLARRTAELYVEAVEYHAPTAVNGKTREQTIYGGLKKELEVVQLQTPSPRLGR